MKKKVCKKRDNRKKYHLGNGWSYIVMIIFIERKEIKVILYELLNKKIVFYYSVKLQDKT